MGRTFTSFAVFAACGVLPAVLMTPLLAAVVKVTPANMQDWSITTNTSGVVQFKAAPLQGTAPAGALWGATGQDYSGQIWAGAPDQGLVGVPISQITKLIYWTFSAAIEVPDTGGASVDGGYGYPQRDPYNSMWWYWHYPQQPWQITLIVQKSATNTSRRTLLYKPWVHGPNGV